MDVCDKPAQCKYDGPIAQLVRAPACHAGGRRFEPVLGRQMRSLIPRNGAPALKGNGLVAQLVERRTENPYVGGSIPPQATIRRCSSIGRATDL